MNTRIHKPRSPRRHTWNRRHVIAPPLPAPPPAVVSVVGIDFDSNNRLVWEFSSEVLSVDGIPPQLQADDGQGGGMRSPDAITDVEENIIIALYNDMAFEGACSWQVLETPDGVVFADGALIVPESGSV